MISPIGYLGTLMPLLIRQGCTFGPISAKIENPDGTKTDLTGAVIRGQIRKTALSPEVLIHIPFEILPIEHEYSFSFAISATSTALLSAGEKPHFPESQYVWDTEIEWPDERVDPLYYGPVTVFREVTRNV